MKICWYLFSHIENLISFKQFWIGCLQKLLKIKRIHFKKFNHAYRISLWLCKVCTKKASCCDYKKLWCIFFEVLQRIKCVRTLLYLIKYNQRLRRDKLKPYNIFQ